MSAEKDQALEALKLETRDDLLQIQAKFSQKEAELMRIIKRQEEESKTYKKQLAGLYDSNGKFCFEIDVV